VDISKLGLLRPPIHFDRLTLKKRRYKGIGHVDLCSGNAKLCMRGGLGWRWLYGECAAAAAQRRRVEL